MRGTSLSALVAVALAGCLSAPATPQGGGGSGGKPSEGSGGTAQGNGGSAQGNGGSGTTGGAGEQGTGGSIATGGGGGSAGNGDSSGSAGSGGTGADAGTTGSGGSLGGAGGTVGTAGHGGNTGTGGTMGSGGTAGTGAGGAMGSAGASGTLAFDMPLRLEDPCGAIQSTTTCLHQGKTSDDGLPFNKMISVNMTGTQGMMYQVKIHVRGIVEPTTISGGTVGTPRQFITGGTAKPDNGNSGDGAYNQWRLTTTVPNQTYYLNAYPNTGHTIYGIDYMETITIGGGSAVKLDVHDANAHLITNTKDAQGPVAPTGLTPLANNNVGQVVQIDIVP